MPDTETTETARGKPYVWATWLAPYLSGDRHCEWALWYRANYQYAKRADDNADRLAQWAGEHAAMVLNISTQLRVDGWDVSVEGQNKFTLNGRRVIVGGKPDIVARKNAEARVVDAKTGQRKGSDVWQVLTYLTLFPMLDDVDRGLTWTGSLVYRDGMQPVRWAEAVRGRAISLDGTLGTEPDGQASRELILARIRGAGMTIGPARTPSADECRYCDVACCPDRISDDKVPSATDAF